MTEVTGDNPQSIHFLNVLRALGDWVLTAIPPEGGRTTTKTFEPSEEPALLEFLQQFNGHQNVYFMVNPARGKLHSKAKKEDVESMDWLHVDLDPAKGEDAAEARPKLQAKLEAFDPPPTIIIDSGGGVQGFWRLDEPLPVGGNTERATEVERYNQQLATLLGGDNCHNVDRIMRLPGTVNIPDQRKRAKGRVERMASIVYLAPEGERVYSLSDFMAAPKVQESAAGGAAVKISGNLPTVLIDDLPEAVTQRTRMLIVQGDDPDDPTRYGSRSDAVFAVCCEMVRAKCDDDVIASVLLDKDYGISAHVLAQKRSAEYAARQIQRAKEQVEEPMLRKMNEKHAVISDLGGKCRVISEVMDYGLTIPRLRVSKQSLEDFRNRYMNVKVQTGVDKEKKPLYAPAGKWWLNHEMRRQYETLVFAPGREVAEAYNLWQGFACDAIPGPNHITFLEHLRDNVCSGNEEHYDYLVRWLARSVQHPGEPGEVAVVLRGGMGTGKGTFINLFGSLWGRHFLQVSSAKHLVGQFNAHLRDCIVLFADEAFFAGDKQHESVLKTLITEDTLVVEGKGLDAEVSPNYTHLLMSSNSHWVIPAGADERRFFVLDVSDANKQNTPYFKKLRDDINNGGREALLYYLLNLDLTGYDVRKVPQTTALREQKLFSLSIEEQWWMERLMDGRTTFSSPEWQKSIQKERLQGDYLRYAESQRAMRRVSPTAMGKFLARVMPKGMPVSIQRMTEVEKDDGTGRTTTTRERAYWYDIPDLETCREEWDKKYGGPYDWPNEEASKTEYQPQLEHDEPY